MNPRDLVSGVEWLRGEGPSSDVVMSSRVRLARNLVGFPFMGRASRDQRREILSAVQRHLSRAKVAEETVWLDMSAVPTIERQVLVERHLISQQFAKGDEPRAAAISSPDERLSIMVNEEDHLRIQVIRAGLQLADAFAQADAADDRIESGIDYMFHPRWGYLSSCPTNVGTGIRVSVMLHMPGLKLTGEIEKVKRAAKAMNLAIRGFYGEGSDAVGDFYQLSNQTTLGRAESDILREFEGNFIPRVIEFERNARRTLAEKRRTIFEDRAWRALGTLRVARLLKSDEALELLSIVRLGVMTDVLPGVSRATVERLFLLTAPAHLQRLLGRTLDQGERRSERARLVRMALAETPSAGA